MWKYDKKLQYPVNIKNKDLRMAKFLTAQYGGPNGELAAGLRYLNQCYTMPDAKGKALLIDIGTEELAHVEIVAAMMFQLMKDATVEELKAAGLGSHYAEHKKSLYPTDANGVPFSVTSFAITGNPMADLEEDIAAELKAGSVLENLMALTNDPDVLAPLSFLRHRGAIHYIRFKELYDEYKKNIFKD